MRITEMPVLTKCVRCRSPDVMERFIVDRYSGRFASVSGVHELGRACDAQEDVIPVTIYLHFRITSDWLPSLSQQPRGPRTFRYSCTWTGRFHLPFESDCTEYRIQRSEQGESATVRLSRSTRREESNVVRILTSPLSIMIRRS
jgi:hypothetical protein